MDFKKIIAGKLLDIKAVSLSPEKPFTWASGILSPIYCDNRKVISYPEIRKMVANGMVDIIKEKFINAEVIVGTATAGIPHAAWVADKLDLPMAYVRSNKKGHGKQNQIEGVIEPGQKVVVIEDLVSTGGSSLKAVEALREINIEVLGLVSIFTYNFKESFEKFEISKLKYESLSNYDELLKVAANRGYIEEKDIEILSKWKENPKGYYNK